MVLMRQSIWELEGSREGGWHPITLAYAKAVGKLRERDPGLATSWDYQAAIHGREGEQKPGWSQCQHGGWFFLPWHRLYLHHFEQIVRSVIEEDGGPVDWALPYWDYDAGGVSNQIPHAFRQQTLPNSNQANPLFLEERAPGINDGAWLPKRVTSPKQAFEQVAFTPVRVGNATRRPGFGGDRTRFEHFWDEGGGLERTPHNAIHNMVGGDGWMADPDQAAKDPIFWLHHANIDRLWASWNNGAPDESAWLDQSFTLFDKAGVPAERSVRDTLDTRELGYLYPGINPSRVKLSASEGMGDNAQETIGASDGGLELVGRPISIDVPIESRRLADLGPKDGAGKRAYLSVEHLEATHTPGSVYAVYASPKHTELDPEAHYVGNLALFGIEKLNPTRAGANGPRNVRLTFDVTDIVASLGTTQSTSELSVAFERLQLGGRDESIEQLNRDVQRPISVGRVSLFTE